MRTRTTYALLAVVCSACSSPTPVQERLPLTREQLATAVPNARMEQTNQYGALRRWVNNPDGSATILRYPRPGAKAATVSKATGRWSITDDGKYCLEEDWSTKAGGTAHWCSLMYMDSEGNLHRLHASQ